MDMPRPCRAPSATRRSPRHLHQSVHGQSGDEALVCKDCHRTHNIQVASTGNHLKSECMSCHKDIATTHAVWLPNTERHLDAISCPACHSPGATRRVNLTLYEGNVPQPAPPWACRRS